MTSEMASLDISIPPSTHCSAARSCGGVRSNSPPRGASSATLIRPTSPPRGCSVEPPQPHSTSVLQDGCDSLLRAADLVQSLCAQACGQPVQTRRSPCARAGDAVEDTQNDGPTAPTLPAEMPSTGCVRKKLCRVTPSTLGASIVHR